MRRVYPVTIIQDRYSGVYSGGKYTAWNCRANHVPPDAWGGDIACADFWHSEHMGSTVRFVGRGPTPQAALDDLEDRLDGYEIPEDQKKWGEIIYDRRMWDEDL